MRNPVRTKLGAQLLAAVLLLGTTALVGCYHPHYRHNDRHGGWHGYERHDDDGDRRRDRRHHRRDRRDDDRGGRGHR